MMNFMDMKHDSNDSSYAEDENSQPVYMITTATQTLPCPTRKIKPIKHPGLVLKTPIAYHSNTDPSVIPIQKDGIGKCVRCVIKIKIILIVQHSINFFFFFIFDLYTEVILVGINLVVFVLLIFLFYIKILFIKFQMIFPFYIL